MKSSKLSRDVIVMVIDLKLDPRTGKFNSKYKNINVLVGDPGIIAEVKEEITSFMKSVGVSCETEWRIY